MEAGIIAFLFLALVAVIAGLVVMFRAFGNDSKAMKSRVAYEAKKSLAEYNYFTRENAAAAEAASSKKA